MYGELDLSPNNLEKEIAAGYTRITRLLEKRQKKFLWRCWNFIPGINQFENGRERYHQFCSGRYHALINSGVVSENDLPAATAVGSDSDHVRVAFLASALSGQSVDNPNQVKAYHYPRQYGTHPPSFSRAYLAGRTLFVSGTASISGHRSQHTNDLTNQLLETQRRLNEITAGRRPRHLRAYVRHRKDFDEVASFIDTQFPGLLTCEITKADICRRELLVEIETIAE